MDLNQLYFDHQIALMRASRAVSRITRQNHRALAAEIARDIFQLHRISGAAAAAGWGHAARDREMVLDHKSPVALA